MVATSTIMSPFLFLEQKLSMYSMERQRLENEKNNHEAKIASICPEIEKWLLGLIPEDLSNQVLFKILKTKVREMKIDNPKTLSLLGQMINGCFDQKDLIFTKEFTWNMYITEAPFVFGFEDLLKAFEKINNFWERHASITVTREGIYYFFRFQRF